MERPSYTRQDTDAVPHEDEKKPYGTTTSIDHSSGEFRGSKESISKAQEAGVLGVPTYHYHDTEAAIGEGEIGALETAEDIVTTVIHVDDDPTINPWTFRMFFIGEFLNHTPKWKREL
jgi:hypothetical protein